MRLKKHSDYALRVLIFLALRKVEVTTIKDIAQVFDISHNHLMKVVQGLGQLGHVKTVRGHKGGIWLGRPANEIYLGAVLRQVGEENELAECFADPSLCRLDALCRLKHVLFQAHEAFFKVLDQVSLADILDQPAAMKALLDGDFSQAPFLAKPLAG